MSINRNVIVLFIITMAVFMAGVAAAILVTREVMNTLVGFVIALIVMTPLTAFAAYQFGFNRGLSLQQTLSGLQGVINVTRSNMAASYPNYMPPQLPQKSQPASAEVLDWQPIPVTHVDAIDHDQPIILN